VSNGALSDQQRGQATVELALVLPFIAATVLLIAQVVVIGQAQLSVQHGVREAARQCAVSPTCDAPSIIRDRSGLDVVATVDWSGDVTVSATAPVNVFVPLARLARSQVVVEASATMRVEGGATIAP
jgi:Flp pilus assembly protein TadG